MVGETKTNYENHEDVCDDRICVLPNGLTVSYADYMKDIKGYLGRED